MARCGYCGTTIVFGGERHGDEHFCNQECLQSGILLPIADQIPNDMLVQQLKSIHEGNCPKCGGLGPVDVHVSHTVYSVLVMTSWRSNSQICCGSCGTKAKIGGIVTSSLFGWWGFPWGFIMTPIQVLRNAAGLFSTPDPTRPSELLEKLVRLHLASSVVEKDANSTVA